MGKVVASTRASILAAAATEFAALGFAGASVDAIAQRAGVNKAMIYYHFRSKDGLYVEILRDVFRGLGGRTSTIVGGSSTPIAKIEAFIDALNEEAHARPYLPSIMVREMAEGGRRLDEGTLRLMAGVFRNLEAILKEGAAAGVFRRVDPVLTYFSLISPVIFFRVTAPARAAMQRRRVLNLRRADADAFVGHLKEVARTVLTAGARKAGPAAPSPRRRTSRSGDHA